jgi:Sulfotransferase family
VNPYVFIVGCARSGTTVLQRIGDAHPQLAVIKQTRWIADWYEKRTALTPDGDLTPEFRERLAGHSGFANLGAEPAGLDGMLENGNGPLAYRDFVTALFDLYGERRAKRRVGDKTPRYVRSIATLHELWPDAKFVHLIRDGHDVALSVLDWSKAKGSLRRFPTWDDDPVLTTALFWEWNVRLGREAGASLGSERYYELRYEALVADPEHESRKLCDFLGLAYDPAMLRFHEGRSRSKPGLDAKKAWRPVTRGLRSWREQMARDDVARFEAAAGLLLDELGYERGAPTASSGELARAARFRDAFAAEVRGRRRAIPDTWASRAP